MQRKTAKQILAESFREVAQTKSIDKITVRDITENCSYSSATFYRQFKDKYDLIAWDYAQATAGIMGRVGVDGYAWRQTLRDGAEYFASQRTYLANLFLHTTGHDSFVRYMSQINYDALQSCLLHVSGKSALDETTQMYLRLYCLGTVSLVCEWILGQYSASPEKLAEVFEQSLPQPLRPFLLEQ